MSLARQEAEQRERVLWRGALLVIVEVGVNVTKVPLPCPDRLPPGGKRCSRVATFVSAARAMATQINEVSGAFPWGWRIVVIANTERDVSIAQHAKNVWRVPTRMAKFKAVAAPIRKKCQERAEPARVRLEIWRQLKQDRPGFIPKDRHPVIEKLQAVDRVLGQAFPVGDELRRFPREDEVPAGFIAPALDGLGWGRAIEDAIQLHGFELAGVIFELMLRCQAHGKEGATP